MPINGQEAGSEPINWDEFLGQEGEPTREPVADDFKALSEKIRRYLTELYEKMVSEKRIAKSQEIVELVERFLKTIGVNVPVKMLDDLDLSMMTVLGRLPIATTTLYSNPFVLVALNQYDIDTFEETPTIYIQNPLTTRPVVFNT